MKRGGIVALATAIIAGFLIAGACQSPGRPAVCAKLVGVSVGSRFGSDLFYLVVINASDSTCMIRTPSIKLINKLGTESNFHQDSITGESGALQLDAHQAAAVPFSLTPGECLQAVQFDYLAATFGGGANVRIGYAATACPVGLIRVWVPISVQRCMDGTIIWPWPTADSSTPTC
jgi:hypothetical protein